MGFFFSQNIDLIKFPWDCDQIPGPVCLMLGPGIPYSVGSNEGVIMYVMLMVGHLIQLYVIQSYYCSRDILTEVALMLKTRVRSTPLVFSIHYSLCFLHIYIVHCSSSTQMHDDMSQEIKV